MEQDEEMASGAQAEMEEVQRADAERKGIALQEEAERLKNLEEERMRRFQKEERKRRGMLEKREYRRVTDLPSSGCSSLPNLGHLASWMRAELYVTRTQPFTLTQFIKRGDTRGSAQAERIRIEQPTRMLTW